MTILTRNTPYKMKQITNQVLSGHSKYQKIVQNSIQIQVKYRTRKEKRRVTMKMYRRKVGKQ